MPGDEDVRQILSQMLHAFHYTSQEIAKLGASLDVLRSAISSTQENPTAYEQQLRQQEVQAQVAALKAHKFPEPLHRPALILVKLATYHHTLLTHCSLPLARLRLRSPVPEFGI
jgi:hypothetical protein